MTRRICSVRNVRLLMEESAQIASRRYQGMAGYWSSSPLEHTRLVRGNAEEEVAKLKQQPGKDLFIFEAARVPKEEQA